MVRSGRKPAWIPAVDMRTSARISDNARPSTRVRAGAAARFRRHQGVHRRGACADDRRAVPADGPDARRNQSPFLIELGRRAKDATASTSGTSSVGPCRAISAATSRSASPACRRFTPARCTTRAAIRSTPSRFRASIGGAFLRVLRERSRESAEIGDQPVAQECRAGLWRRNVAQKTRAETSRTGAAQDFSPACACCNACRRQNGLFSGWSVTARQAR